LQNGRSFQRIEKIRKRYKCMELSSKRMYLFNPIAEVFLLEQ
jgi:SprT protein